MQRAVMLRVGVAIKQIDNKHFQNLLVFRAWNIWVFTKIIAVHCPQIPSVAWRLSAHQLPLNKMAFFLEMQPTLAMRNARRLAYLSVNCSPDRSYEACSVRHCLHNKVFTCEKSNKLSNFVETCSSTHQGPQKPIYRHRLFQA